MPVFCGMDPFTALDELHAGINQRAIDQRAAVHSKQPPVTLFLICGTQHGTGIRPALKGGGHHIQHMGGVSGEYLPVPFYLVRQFKEKLTALIIPFEKGCEQEIPLGQIGGMLARIAVGGGGRDTAGPVHKACHGFMESHILVG